MALREMVLMANPTASYTADGLQAVYLLRAGGEEAWYTDAEKAIKAWENNQDASLFVGRSNNDLTKIR